MQQVDIAVIGAGTAGIPAAIEAAQAGASVVVIEQSDRIGGTLHVSAGQMSGSRTRLQRERGIDDSPQAHVDDARRISRDTCNIPLVAKAAELAGETVDWLMALGFDVDPACPAILHLHDRDWVYEPAGSSSFRRVEVVGGDTWPGNRQEVRSGLEPGQRVVANALVLQNTVEQ